MGNHGFMKVAMLALAICFLGMPPMAHAEEAEFEPTPADRYREEGVTIVLPADWPPFSFENAAGERDGYLPQIWHAWGDHSGLDYRLVYIDDAQGVAAIKEREADIHGGLRHSLAREEVMDFAESLHSTTTILAIRDNSPVDCSNALYDTPVGIVDGSPAQKAFGGKYPETETAPFPDAESAATALFEGTIHAVAVPYTPLIRAARERGQSNTLDVCRSVHFDEIYAAVQKDDEELLTLVTDGFTAIPQPEWERIRGQWFEKRESRTIDWQGQVVPALAVFAFMVVIVVLWVRRKR